MWRKQLVLGGVIFVALQQPTFAEDALWEVYRDDMSNSCSLRSEQNGYMIDFNFVTKDFGQNSVRVHNDQWKFTDSGSYLIKTILRYSDGDQIHKETEFSAIYDENYLQSFDQLLQLNVLSLQAETGVKINEMILDFDGQNDIKFNTASMYDDFPDYWNCVKEARDIEKEKEGDAAEARLNDPNRELTIGEQAEKLNSNTLGFCPPTTHGTQPNCIPD